MALRLSDLPVAFSSAAFNRSSWSEVSGTAVRTSAASRCLALEARSHEAVDDRRDVAAAAGADHHRDELHGGGGGLAVEEVLDDRLALLGRAGSRRSAWCAARRSTRTSGRSGTARPRPRRGCLRRGRSRTAPVRSLRSVRRSCARSCACADPLDESFDERLVGGVVERLVDDALDGDARSGGRSRHAVRRSSARRRRRCRPRRELRARPSRRRGGSDRRRSAPRPGLRPRRGGGRARLRCRPGPGGCRTASASAVDLGRRRIVEFASGCRRCGRRSSS